MKLFSFQVPEVAHLPPEEREAVLKRCVQSPRFLRYRKIAPRIVGATLVIAYGVILFLDWGMIGTVSAVVCLLLVLLALKITGEVWLLRVEARKATAAAP